MKATITFAIFVAGVVTCVVALWNAPWWFIVFVAGYFAANASAEA